MPSELLPTLEVVWPFAAPAAVAILALVVIVALWRGQSARRQPVREYDREQRALRAFRRHLTNDDAATAKRPRRSARDQRAVRRSSSAPGAAGVRPDDRPR
jgi:type II secretory pathway component PulM